MLLAAPSTVGRSQQAVELLCFPDSDALLAPCRTSPADPPPRRTTSALRECVVSTMHSDG
ncbi:hypothetical protein GCM10017771_83620 [Streptomyces capitiformicae]|uniref:Uncharacterized protein n=1 Tax=Streptomyces capitiformicae TaxID=2014920 RepID=A0A918ZLY2_9ACTN|nr:hypothetical protein GCM10017771_83620 [Streptomyces capitiformicae]